MAQAFAERLLPGWVKPVLVRVQNGEIVEPAQAAPGEQAAPPRANAVSVGSATSAAPDAARAAAARGGRVVLLLSPEHILTHEITLPLAAEGELAAAIDLHLERELPLPLAQACIHWRVVSRDRANGRLRVRVYIAHLAQVEKFVKLLAARGHRLSRVAISTGSNEFEGDLLPQRPYARKNTFRITPLDRRLAMICVSLAAVFCGVVAIQWTVERMRVSAELRRVDARAKQTRALARELARSATGPNQLIALMARPDAVDVLRTLTSDIAEDTWAYEVEIKGTSSPEYQVRLAAYAAAATMFVGALEKTPKFDHVRLVSATSAGLGTARDRLTVTARFQP
jgi:hypothetical protein